MLLIFLLLELLCGLSCTKSGLKESERILIRDTERFNREYGSKGLTIKNKKIDWGERLRFKGLILKNSLIENVELQAVDLRNMYMENSTVENVFLRGMADLSGSTFKNVKFKNLKFRRETFYFETINRLNDSIFIDCEFVNCDFNDEIVLGKEYINCKFRKCDLKDNYEGKFENVIFEKCFISFKLKMKDSKNVQFINCTFASFKISGKADDLLIQNAKTDLEYSNRWRFEEGIFSNVTIIDVIDCKEDPIINFNKINLNNLLIKNIIVSHLEVDEANITGDNKIEKSEIFGNFYGRSKIRNLTIKDCQFYFYVDVVFSELIGLKLINNTYKILGNDSSYPGEVRHAVIGEKFIDSDRFPLKSTPFPEDSYYVQGYYNDIKKTSK